MSFDFGAAVKSNEGDAFHPALSSILEKGNHVVTVIEVEGVRTNTANHYPMVKVTLENEDGRQWDNLVISPNDFSVAKLLGFAESAGVAAPDPDKGEISPQDGALSDAWLQQFMGKKVGLIVRDEEDNRPDHAGEMRPRVKGYVAVSTITGGPDTRGLPESGEKPAGGAADDDIPF